MVVECDTGRKRAGVETPAEAIALARRSRRQRGCRFAGFMLYPTETGWAEAQRFYDEALAGVRAEDWRPTIVSTGGTPNLKNLGKLRGATEHRPGTYIYPDRMQRRRRRRRAGTTARSTSTPPWSAAPVPTAASSMPAPRS